jgi:molybdopterin converting factor small subunit
MPVVAIPPPYRKATGGAAEVSVSGATVLDCLEAVEKKHGGFLAFVLDSGGGIQRFVKLFVNGDELDAGKGLATPVADRDRVTVVSAIAGG